MNMMEDKYNTMQTCRLLEMDDTFEFGCAGCGMCCYGHDDIILTGFDVYRLAQKLQTPPADVLLHYCDMYVGAETKMPVAVMGKTKRGACPLLAYGKCTVHDHKPVTCALYPIGRGIEYGDGHMKVTYFMQPVACNKMDLQEGSKVHTLREWLAEYNLLDQDENICAWVEATINLLENAGFKWYKENYDKLSSVVTDLFWKAAEIALFKAYDLERPFAEQIKKNVDNLCGVLDGLLLKLNGDLDLMNN